MRRKIQIELPQERIEDFCRRWNIIEFSVFGSVLREDFRPDSDIDVLVTFSPLAKHSVFDLSQMTRELEHLFQRKVDFVERRLIEQSQNYIRRRAILESAELVHAT